MVKVKKHKIKKFVKPANKQKPKVSNLKQKPRSNIVVKQQKHVKTQSQQHTIIIPGITGPIIPEAHADPIGALRWVPKKQAVGVLKGMFGMTGKHAGVTDKRGVTGFLKAKKKIEKHGGEYQFFLKPQTGVHVPKSPKRKVWDNKLKRSVTIDPLRVQSATGETVIVQQADRGAAKAWYETLFITAKGPAERGSGGMKDKVSKLLKDKKTGGMKRVEGAYAFNFGYSGKNLPREGIFTDLSGNLVSASRVETGAVAGKWKPKAGETYTAKMLPEGAGIQTKYIKWGDQSASAPVIAKGKDGKLVQVRPEQPKGKITMIKTTDPSELNKQAPGAIDLHTSIGSPVSYEDFSRFKFHYPGELRGPGSTAPSTQAAKALKAEYLTAKPSGLKEVGDGRFVYPPIKERVFKGKATGTTTVVKASPTKTTLPAAITKKQLRQVRKDVLAGEITTARQLRNESHVDSTFANAVNKGTLKLDQNMDLALWQRLDWKQKAVWLAGKGLL